MVKYRHSSKSNPKKKHPWKNPMCFNKDDDMGSLPEKKMMPRQRKPVRPTDII